MKKRLARMLLLAAVSAVGRAVQKKVRARNQRVDERPATPADGHYKTYSQR